MRGRILQYNGNDGTGLISADGQQYPFQISMWKSDTPPAVGKTVEVVLAEGRPQSVSLVADDVLMREKTAELTGKLGSFVGELSSGLAKGGAATGGGGVIGFYGRNLVIAYAVYLLGTLFFNAISIKMMGQSEGKPLFELASLLSQIGGGGGVKFGLILAYLGFAVPFFWRDRRAWLLLLLPLVVLLYALWSGTRALSGGGGPGGGMGDLFSFGIGFYLALISGVVLAAGGVKRFLTST
jgi:hypothetical protein